jgi:hypothetical protein
MLPEPFIPEAPQLTVPGASIMKKILRKKLTDGKFENVPQVRSDTMNAIKAKGNKNHKSNVQAHACKEWNKRIIITSQRSYWQCRFLIS